MSCPVANSQIGKQICAYHGKQQLAKIILHHCPLSTHTTSRETMSRKDPLLHGVSGLPALGAVLCNAWALWRGNFAQRTPQRKDAGWLPLHGRRGQAYLQGGAEQADACTAHGRPMAPNMLRQSAMWQSPMVGCCRRAEGGVGAHQGKRASGQHTPTTVAPHMR